MHRGLSEIKMLGKRIERLIDTAVFIGSKKKASEKVNDSTLKKDEFVEEIKSNFQSIQDLINRKNLIKRLIVISNSIIKIEVWGKAFTVAEAIKYKKIIEYKKQMLSEMRNQYIYHMAMINKKNEAVEQNLDMQIQAMLGSDKQSQNEWEMVYGLSIENLMKSLVCFWWIIMKGKEVYG